uniref:Uncharacterized protein n=1 Tax=Solanum lycopersicum TaxID=4081 RepID=A0A3Q7JVV3_SOLLC
MALTHCTVSIRCLYVFTSIILALFYWSFNTWFYINLHVYRPITFIIRRIQSKPSHCSHILQASKFKLILLL